MNRLITYGSVEAIPFYNCSWKSSEEWWATGVQRPWLGIPTVILGVLFELLYIPIIFIIFKTRLIKYPCYKIIIMLALADMTAITCSCLVTGVFLIQGAVFCNYPTFIYFQGAFGLANWCMTCAITVSLFSNRIVSIAFKEYADEIEKKLAYSSMVLCVLYFFYIFFFTQPAAYNSNIMAWIPDPLSEPTPSAEATEWYQNKVVPLHNVIYSGLMFVLFTVYYILVKKLAKGQKCKASRQIFIQSCVICFFNTSTAVVYFALNHITLNFYILLFVQIAWSISHGVPAMVYVTLNDTIRREFKKMFLGRRRIDEKRSSLANLNSISNSRH